MFFSAAILAGAFSSFLAYLLTKMDGVGGYEGWRWIFIMEGIITCVIAFGSIFAIAPWPKDSKFLTAAEKEHMLARLEADSSKGRTEHWSGGAIKAVLMDWKIWLA
jgi:MFS family permease